MCGISGIVKFNGQVERAQLEAMNRIQAHRGPDDSGFYMDDGIGLAHNRLSILDLSPAGRQPFISHDQRYVIVFNGEIFNYRQFYDEAEAKAYPFRSSSDTEVLLYLYAKYGTSMLDLLNGMFALAIWDTKEKTLFAARDRMGVKPFQYVLNADGFLFASEEKALLKAGVPFEINESKLDELLIYRSIGGENTIFKGINRLLPGYYVLVHSNGRVTQKRWYNLAERIKAHPRLETPEKWFEETLHSAIKYRMISDVPVGVLLSAGMDSASVARSLYLQNFKGINTFNVAFKDYVDDESGLAERLSHEYGFNFHKFYLEDNDLTSSVDDSVYYHDEPLMHFNDPQILAISRYAKNKVSVLLSGEGADEVLGGYLRYKTYQLQPYWSLLKAVIRHMPAKYVSNRMKKLHSYLGIPNNDLKLLFNASNNFPVEFRRLGINTPEIFPEYRTRVISEAKDLYPGNLYRQQLYFDQHTYLQSLNMRNDRATMAASIECREPFMDYRLIEGVGTMPNNLLFSGRKNKKVLRETIGAGLPAYIRNFRKIGFNVPWTEYMAENPYFREHLEGMEHTDIMKMGVFARLNIPKIREEYLKHGEHKLIIKQIFFISLWYKKYYKRIQNN